MSDPRGETMAEYGARQRELGRQEARAALRRLLARDIQAQALARFMADRVDFPDSGAGGEEHCKMLVEREYGWVLALVRGGGAA